MTRLTIAALLLLACQRSAPVTATPTRWVHFEVDGRLDSVPAPAIDARDTMAAGGK